MRLPVQCRYQDYRLETLPRDELKRRQFARLKAVLERAYHQSRFYRRLFDDAKVHPDQVTSWDDFHGRVPFIDKRALLADQAQEPPWGRKLMVPPDDIRKVYITSGTSGVGQEIHPMTEGDFGAAADVGFFCFTWAGIEKGDLNALFWPLATMAGGQVAYAGLERFGANVMALGIFDSNTKIRRLLEFRHHYVWATPVYLTRLTHLCRETGMHPAVDLPNLKGIVLSTGAFPVEWVQGMEEFWGTRLYDCFGSTQIRSIYAATCERGAVHDGRRGSYHPAEPFVLAEITDPAKGKPVPYGDEGELVITNLYQEAAPMIRFRQGDRIRRLPPDACDCGRTWEAWEAGTISRYDDMLKIRGQNVWPLAVDEAVFAYREIEEYSGRVYVAPGGTEEVVLSVEFRKETPALDRPGILAGLPEQLRQRTGIRMAVAEVAYGTIPRFEYKAVRWADERQAGLTKVTFTEK